MMFDFENLDCQTLIPLTVFATTSSILLLQITLLKCCYTNKKKKEMPQEYKLYASLDDIINWSSMTKKEKIEWVDDNLPLSKIKKN